MRGLLFFFGCQLHHLSPTGILHIANFINFCEFYLTAPQFELFCHFFIIRVQMNGEASVSLQLRLTSKFFHVSFPRSLRVWHRNWLYASSLSGSLLAFVDGTLRWLRSWDFLDILSKEA